MKRTSTYSIVGGIVAFILSLSCCWLPALIIGLGGATGMMAFADGLESYSGILMTVGGVLLGFGGYRYYQSKQHPEACCDKAERCC